jgi:hypothetical protein
MALSQSPLIKSAINFKVSSAGVADALGLQSAQTEPPPTNEKYLCGPGASHFEQLTNDGA